MRATHRAATLAAAALLLAGGSTGCSLLDRDSGGGTGGGTSAAVGKPAIDATGGKPLAKGTFPSPISEGATVDLAVMGLKASGKLATLTVQLTPHVPGTAEPRPNPYNLNGGNSLGTSLIDPVGLKRYVVVKDSGGKELESDDIFTHIANNQMGALSYTFAAPPESVKAVDVQIGSWPTFRNIPVER